MSKSSSALSQVLWHGCIVCFRAFSFCRCPQPFLTHTWHSICLVFVTTLWRNGVKQKASTWFAQVCLSTAQSFLSVIFDSQVNRFKIKYKDFQEGYSVDKDSKNTRSWSTVARLNLKLSWFTRTHLNSFCTPLSLISNIPFQFLVLFFLSPFYLGILYVIFWKNNVNQFLSNFKLFTKWYSFPRIVQKYSNCKYSPEYKFQEFWYQSSKSSLSTPFFSFGYCVWMNMFLKKKVSHYVVICSKFCTV